MRSSAQPRTWFRLRSSRLLHADHPVIRNYFADRCTHLAAMVAYYALLSLVPFLFLLFSLTGALGRPTEGSFLVQELGRVLPGQSLTDLIRLIDSLRANARSFGIVGAVGLAWSTLGFLSALESALNIIYDVPNRAFLRQKLFILGLVSVGLSSLFASLVLTTALYSWVKHHRPTFLGVVNLELVLSVLFSSGVSFAFLLVVYRLLPNTEVHLREVIPGAIVATVAFQASFQALPLYLNYSASQPALKAFGGFVVLLVWLFLMSNVILIGAQLNWWHGPGRRAAAAEEPPIGLA